MKHITAIITIFTLTLIGTAAAVLAQSSGHEGMQMETGGAMIVLGTVTTDGIKAMAHLQDLRQGAAQRSGQGTHNLMVIFEDDRGTAITTGRAAVKVTGPDGQTGNAITLNPKDGFFSADLELKIPGHYAFEVGAKVAADKARQFHFSFEQK